MVTVGEIYSFIDSIAPFDTQMDFDNSGLLVGSKNDKVNKVINCFELNIFEENSREILKCHDYILNTSGIKKISDMFHMNWSKNSILT